MNSCLGEPCNRYNLEGKLLDCDSGFIQHNRLGWNPGTVIANKVRSKRDIIAGVERLLKDTRDPQDIALHVSSARQVYINCPPCATHIKTALHLCVDRDIPPHVEFLVRVDDRLISDCFADESGVDRLALIVDVVREVGSNADLPLLDDRMPFIDLPWAEQRLYRLEEEDSPHIDPQFLASIDADPAVDIIQEEQSDLECAAAIVVAPVSQCSDMMDKQTAPTTGRQTQARETEIFLLEREANSRWKRRFLMRYLPKRRRYHSDNRLCPPQEESFGSDDTIPHPPLPDPRPLSPHGTDQK